VSQRFSVNPLLYNFLFDEDGVIELLRHQRPHRFYAAEMGGNQKCREHANVLSVPRVGKTVEGCVVPDLRSRSQFTRSCDEGTS
jgi:hypothetical protein